MSQPQKFTKNVKFSRNKSFAYTEGDIVRNDAKLNSLLEERQKERTQNLKTAGKIVDDEDEGNVVGESSARESSARESSARESSAREGSAREGRARESSARESRAREGRDTESNKIITFERKYYTKMNLVIRNLPSDYDVDKLCKTFEQLGSIMFVSKMPNADGNTYNAKIVPNEWSEPIGAIQQEIFDRGFSEYRLKSGNVCHITKDREQKFADFGDSYQYEEEEDDEDE
jgi:hypothetical protein